MKQGEIKNRNYDHKNGWTIYPDATPGANEHKAPWVDNGTDVFDGARYHDPEMMKREWDRLWTRVWTIAGRVSDIPEVGDWFKYDLGPESFIIVRTGPGPSDIRAFYNVCQHRGNRLVSGEFGSAADFVCGFHSWAWTIDGKLKHVQDRETYREELLCENLDLSDVRCAIWGGFVFINMDPDAPELMDYLAELPQQLAPYGFDDMVVVKDVETAWPANWKTALDAFLESYHVHAVHSEILGFYDDYYQQWDLLSNGMSRMLMQFGTVSPRMDDQTSVNEGLRAMMQDAGMDPDEYTGDAAGVRQAIIEHRIKTYKEQGQWNDGFTPGQATDDWAFYIFPNVTLNIHPEGFLFQRFRPDPKDPERFIYDIQVIVKPVEEGALPVYMGVEDGTDLSGATRPERRHIERGEPGLGFVLEQDSVLVPVVQQGLKSRGFKGLRFSEQEQRLRHYHVELDRYLNGKK